MKEILIEKEQGEDVIVTITDKSEPIPPPIEEPFVLIDSAVKGVNGYQHNYQGGGWTDGQNVPGWYLGTLSYTATKDAYVAMKFNGTKIEWYTEKGPSHGIVGVSIDGLTETMIDLYQPEYAPMIKVWESEKLEQVLHTVKLRCTGTKNAASSNFYAITDLFKVFNPQTVPDVPIPPSSDVIVRPGESIKAATEAAVQGKRIVVKPGTYNESNINVPVGVNMKAEGEVNVIAITPGQPGQTETGLFSLKSQSPASVNQTIEGFNMKGNNVGYGGIIVENRNNVKLLKNNISDFNCHGIWLRTVMDSEISDCDLYNTSFANTSFSYGQINIFALTNVIIQRNKIRSDKNNKGTGIEALWKQSTMKNLKILHNQFALSHQNPWNNGQAKNFSIEIHDTHYDGIEIAYNDFKNQLSMASHFKAKTSAKTLIHHNTGDLGGDTCFIENICDNLEAYDNTVTNGQMFAANFQPNSVWVNNKFYRNNFVSSGLVSWGGMFLIGPMGVQGFVIDSNVFTLKGNKKIAYMGVTGGVTETNNTWNP